MPHRYFCPQTTPDSVLVFLSGEEAHHLSTVMRGKIGEEIIICDTYGGDYLCKIQSLTKSEVTLEIISYQKSVSEPTVQVTLYVGYPKQDKLELIIQKATELGAVKIVPFFSRYCVATPKNEEKKSLRYNRIAIEAAKQSGRGIIPNVEMPISYKQMLTEASQNQIAFFCYEANGSDNSIHSQLKCNDVTSIAVITGSEGGFSQNEADDAVNANCKLTGLGPRILRCETAPIAALSAIMALTGNL